MDDDRVLLLAKEQIGVCDSKPRTQTLLSNRTWPSVIKRIRRVQAFVIASNSTGEYQAAWNSSEDMSFRQIVNRTFTFVKNDIRFLGASFILVVFMSGVLVVISHIKALMGALATKDDKRFGRENGVLSCRVLMLFTDWITWKDLVPILATFIVMASLSWIFDFLIVMLGAKSCSWSKRFVAGLYLKDYESWDFFLG